MSSQMAQIFETVESFMNRNDCHVLQSSTTGAKLEINSNIPNWSVSYGGRNNDDQLTNEIIQQWGGKNFDRDDIRKKFEEISKTGDFKKWTDGTSNPYVRPYVPNPHPPLQPNIGPGVNVTDFTLDLSDNEQDQVERGKEGGQIEIRRQPNVVDILVEIAKLDLLEVRQVLDKFGVKVTDRDGNVIYDPEKQEEEIKNRNW